MSLTTKYPNCWYCKTGSPPQPRRTTIKYHGKQEYQYYHKGYKIPNLLGIILEKLDEIEFRIHLKFHTTI